MRIAVIELWTYPVKALRGVSLTSVQVTPCGFQTDRRWMVVDANGKHLTQREINAMARITAVVQGPNLLLAADDAPDLLVPASQPFSEVAVTVWGSEVRAADCGDVPASWLQDRLGAPCRLVYMTDPRSRPVNPAYGRAGEYVSFADGLPVLLTTMASLADLNTRMANGIGMERFRPNLVVDGELPWAEDDWQEVRVGAVSFRVAGSCPRCIVSTNDQVTGVRPPGNEPLRALGGFRRDKTGVVFGRYLVPLEDGSIRVGDTLSVTR